MSKSAAEKERDEILGEANARNSAVPDADITFGNFVEAVALDRAVLVTPGQARQVMEITLAADLSAERHQPVSLPLQT